MDAAPLTLAQLCSLSSVAVRELLWIVPNVAREVRFWRARAQAIPDEPLRADALDTLKRERLSTEGAALLAAVPRQRSRPLLRLLVAYEILLDYLDTVSERPVRDPLANGRQLQRALVDALDPGRLMADYYRHHPWGDDAGYLQALVRVCREMCALLPAYERVGAAALEHARRFDVQVLNHDPDPQRREDAIAAWASREFPGESEFAFFELAAAASSTLAIHSLLALASEARVSDRDVVDLQAAYFPWINVVSTMLDSHVDRAQDAATGDHSYVAYYGDPAVAATRIAELVLGAVNRARALKRGSRHALVASGMVAMFLSSDAARRPDARLASDTIGQAAGSLYRVQLPILRAFRVAHGLRCHDANDLYDALRAD
jgi:tetraprenyl-beta-curcumene synthase